MNAYMHIFMCTHIHSLFTGFEPETLSMLGKHTSTELHLKAFDEPSLLILFHRLQTNFSLSDEQYKLSSLLN